MNNKTTLTVIALMFLLICSMFYFMPKELVSAVHVDNFDSGMVYVHCDDYFGNASVVQNGAGKIVNAPLSQYSAVLANCHNVKGVEIKYDANSVDDVHTLISQLKATIYDSQQLGELYIVYGYSPLVKSGILIDGELVNVQIAYNQGVVTVGSPIILGSF